MFTHRLNNFMAITCCISYEISEKQRLKTEPNLHELIIKYIRYLWRTDKIWIRISPSALRRYILICIWCCNSEHIASTTSNIKTTLTSTKVPSPSLHPPSPVLTCYSSMALPSLNKTIIVSSAFSIIRIFQLLMISSWNCYQSASVLRHVQQNAIFKLFKRENEREIEGWGERGRDR